MIETILVLTLMGVMSASVIAGWDMSEPYAQNAMLKLAGDIRYAQNRAMVTGQAHGFRTITNNQYEIYVGVPGTPADDPGNGQPMVFTLDNNFGATLFQGVYQVQFDSLGTPTVGGGSVIALQNGAAVRNLTIVNDTGKVNM